MAQAQGSSARTYIGMECDTQQGDSRDTYWGAAALRASYKGFATPFKSNTLRKSVDQILSEQIQSTREPSAPARGNVDISGDIGVEMNAKAHGLLWFLALGNRTEVTTVETGSGSTHNKHQFWVGELPSVYIEKQFTDVDHYFRYSGCYVNTLSLTMTSAGFADLTVGFMGKQETNVTTPYYTAGNTVDVGGTTFDMFNTFVGEGGTTLTNFTDPAVVLEASLEINNNLDGSAVLLGGGGLRAGIAVGVPQISGNLRAIFKDASLYNKARDKTETSLQFIVKNAAAPTFINSSEALRITLPEVYLTPNAPPIEGMGGVILDLNYAAFFADETMTGQTTACHVTLRNQVPNYKSGA